MGKTIITTSLYSISIGIEINTYRYGTHCILKHKYISVMYNRGINIIAVLFHHLQHNKLPTYQKSIIIYFGP